MTPAARIAAAIGVLDQVLDGTAAEPALLRWSRASRFAGSGDRAAVRDLVFTALRRRDSLAAAGGALTGRGLMIGLLRTEGRDPGALFTGAGHAPGPLTDAERVAPTPLPGHEAATDIPGWLWPAWQRALGPDAMAIARAMTRRAPVWLRVNIARTTPAKLADLLADEGIATAPSPLLDHALCITEGERRLSASRPYADGLVELQDLSAQLACAALPLPPEARVLDYCAGGGGKVLALAARAPRARFLAHDADPARMRDLSARAERAGARIAISADPGGQFDLVVADVPCSGSGTWRRTPDAKWRLTPSRLDDLRRMQAQILDRVAPLVARGGHLAYMTCSLLDAENRDQIAAFQARHPGFAAPSIAEWTPLTASDGFFLAVLRHDKD